MDLRLLGPVEVRVDDGPIELGPRQQRAMLAMLALEVGRRVLSEVASVARAPVVPADPELQVVASEFVASALAGKDPSAENDILWRVRKHLLPFFAVYVDGPRRGQDRHFSELDDALVDRYIAFKLADAKTWPTFARSSPPGRRRRR